jgi:sec-independent protein translocase protein TatB
MLDVGLSEVLVIVLVAFFLLSPKDVPEIVRTLKAVMRKVSKFKNDFLDEVGIKGELSDIRKEVKAATRHIVDLEGNIQEAYDLSDIMPDLKEPKKKVELKKPTKEFLDAR